jgi:hypothetical protein
MTYESFEQQIKTAASNVSWFNGTSESIFNRLDLLEDLLSRTRTAASDPNVADGDLERYASTITELAAEKEQLEKIASEYVDFDVDDYLNSLPGGTVAKEYRLSSAGTYDLGEDDGSLLFKTASAVQSEYDDADWINFVTAGAEVWTEDQSHYLLDSQINTREAAVFYVEKKTLPILDVTKRAAIIDNFVDNVEICRRAKTAGNSFRALKVASASNLKANFVQEALDDSFGDNINWF